MLFNDHEALDFVHEYSKQACLALEQVEAVTIVNEMELTVKAVEGHTFTIPLQPLQEQVLQLKQQGETLDDAELIYYMAKRVNESLGYTNIWPIDRPLVYPVVKNTAFIHSLSDAQIKEIVHQAYEGDLWVCYAVYREGLHYLTHEQLKYTLGIATEDLHALALDNLAAAQRENINLAPLFQSLWQLSHERQYADDAGVLFIAPVWEGIKEKLNIKNIAITLPCAHCVLLCDADDETAMADLRQRTDDIYDDSDEPLSKFIFWWNPESIGWQTSRFVNFADKIMNPYKGIPFINY